MSAPVEPERTSLRRLLLTSHLGVAIIAAALLLVVLVGVGVLNRSGGHLADEVGPKTIRAMQVQAEVERTLAALRGWMATGAPETRTQRREAWARIWASVDQMSADDLPEDVHLDEFRAVLRELEAVQWAIEDVARTPGDDPAQAHYGQRAAPRVDAAIAHSSALLDGLASRPRGAAAPLRLLSDLRSDLGRSQVALVHAIATRSPGPLTTHHWHLDRALAGLDQLDAALADAQLTPEERDRLLLLRAAVGAWRGEAGVTRELLDAHPKRVSAALLVQEATPRVARVSRTFERVAQAAEQEMVASGQTVRAVGAGLLVGTVLALLALLALAWRWSMSASQRIAAPVAGLAEAASAIAEGGAFRTLPLGDQEELATLTLAFNRMQQRLERSVGELEAANDDLLRRSLVQTALGELEQPLRAAAREEDVARAILDFLVERLGAAVGAVHVVDDAGFHVAASHGVDRVEPGRGLVAEVARRGQLRWLRALDGAWSPVATGTGQTQPTAVLLLPLIPHRSVRAVVELAFLTPPDEPPAGLLAGISSRAAAAMERAAGRERVEALLVRTRDQATRLQEHQEELRATNEALTDRSRRLQASEERLQQQQEELRVTNEELVEQARALEEQQTDLEQANHELEVARDEVERRNRQIEEASRYKSEFLANMSHELRTPLNSILILSRLLGEDPDGALSDKQIEFAETIQQAGRQLLTLISDILDLSKVEAGRLDVNPEATDVAGLVSGVERLFGPQADDKGVALRVAVDEAVPARVVVDPMRLEQVLRNLLSNALKFTEEGEVALLVDVAGGADDLGPPALRFAVRDTGIGIPPDRQEAIFEAFRQVDGSTSRRFGGTGLGLAICRHLAELMDGALTLSSALGQGSAFVLTLPLIAPGQASAPRRPAPAPGEAAAARRPASPPAPTTPPSPSAHAARPPRLLVVEDDDHYAKILGDLAVEWGFEATRAETGAAALHAVGAARVDAVLLDIGLPDMSGWQVLERLRRSHPDLPVHVVSGTSDPSAAAQHRVQLLEKPASAEQLREVLRALLPEDPDGPPAVLLVEDDPAHRLGLQAVLEGMGARVTSAATAAGALDALRSRRFALCVLDLGLPDVEPTRVLSRLRSQAGDRLPPIIVHTGRELTDAEEAALYRDTEAVIIKGARSVDRLVQEASLFLTDVQSRHAQTTAPPPPYDPSASLDGHRCLLVDDDMRNLFSLTKLLEAHGVEVIPAQDGLEAVEIAEGRADIDVVLMDLMMPRMDGLEATRRLRALPAWADVPILALTAKAMPGDRDRCLEAGASDYLSKPVEPDRLLAQIRLWLHQSGEGGVSLTPEDRFELELDLLLDGVRRASGHDFRGYARPMVARRARRRCDLEQLPGPLALLQRALDHPPTLHRFVDDLSIRTTEFFRDPRFFAALREDVLPLLATFPRIRVWQAGCATGEETVSLAIAFAEAGLLERTRIFATDMSEAALAVAADGIYPEARLEGADQAWRAAGGERPLSDYYAEAYGRVAFAPALLRNVLFANHNLVTDDVFGEMHLAVCRNVLIYFDTALQERALDLFHRALRPLGLLCLGARESVRFTAFADRFTPLRDDVRIFQKA